MTAATPREEAIFAALMDVAPNERAALLDVACGDDDELRARVEQLLALHDTAGDFLETPALGPPEDDGDQRPGATIGRYRLVERLGAGGFGVVWRAEQEEPVRREVALKLIKLGMDTRQVIARFEAERQALAMMNHGNIATVLDAGSTAATDAGYPGRPYFVMELVDGQSIDRYCDQQRLPVRERLKLFTEICGAVQHAHQKGIVHRDLKPSNILVAADDGRPVAKIIDFGIAKALHSSPAGGESPTAAPQLVGTPEYMSPEQITRDLDIDTRADVYALGCVLYKLLVGVAPLDTATRRQAGLDELSRAIREDEPQRPSTRVLKLDDALSIANCRSTRPAALRRSLRGDLDWIVLKALEKDRSRRYESAAELARDIQRHLACQAITAGPPGALYRVKKFVGRNRVAVLAASLVLVALIGGAVAATVGLVHAQREGRKADQQWQRAERERQTAESQRALAVAEAEKAQRVAQLLENVIGATDPERGHPVDFTVRQQLDAFAESLDRDEELANQPDVKATLLRTVGRSYMTLRELDKAEPRLERALALRRELLAEDHPLVSESRLDYALLLKFAWRMDEAQREVDQLLPQLREAGPSEQLVQALMIAGSIHDDLRNRYAAEALARQAWHLARQVHGAQHAVTLVQQGRLAFHAAHISRTVEERQEAEQLGRDALQNLQTRWPDAHFDIALVKVQLAAVLTEMGDFDGAELLIREALAMHRELLGEESTFVVRDMIQLAGVLRRQGDPQAEKVAREAVAMAERSTVDRDFLCAGAYFGLMRIVRPDDPHEAADLWGKTIAARRRLAGDSPAIARVLRLRARLLSQLGRWEEAAACLQDALAITLESGSAEAVDRIQLDLVEVLRQTDDRNAGAPSDR